ncbi:MAG: hypothetical protein QOC71_1493 [Thermoplasmata archaeon]|jgi:PAS domain S-box-containing protein|nr:hypothetical protein [Thermoplasmata archaeon]
MQTATKSTWAHIRDSLPEGTELPRATWETRHRFILWVIAGHAVALPVFGLYHGWSLPYAIGESAVVAALGLVAAMSGLSKTLRMVMASFALVTASAVLVQFSGGYIEAHFHYFIVVALVALYQDWAPFLLAILYVAVEHGILGMVHPDWVFNHPAGFAEPWKWALIHAVAILGECVALLAFWAGAEEASARSDLVLESAGEGVVGLDAAGRITFVNPAAATVFGRREDDLIGRDIRLYVDAVAPAIGTPRSGPRDGLLTSSDGSPVPIEWSLTPMVRSGASVGAVMILRDISERHAMEEQLRQHRLNLESMVDRRTAQLTEANRELEAFSYTVSHDLRSPLRSIDGFSRILIAKHGKDLPEDARAMLEMLGDGAIRMGGLIESILALSRLSRVELRHAPVDLSAMAHGILHELQEKDPDRHVVWQVDAGLRAHGDAGLLRLALLNLLQNSWKFTAPAKEPRIAVRAVPAEGEAAFVVEDNGAGFDMALAKDLFQPFHRLHTPSEFEGTGIGLATVSRIVKRHGGRIWADAEAGRGARFFFTLPATAPAPVDGVMQAAPADPGMVTVTTTPTPAAAPTGATTVAPSPMPMESSP